MITTNIVKNDNREYTLVLEKIGFIKSRIIKSGNEIDGVQLTFAPKCELLIFSSTRKYPMQFAHIYFVSHDEGKNKSQSIVSILEERGLDGFVEYIKTANPSTFIEKNNILYSTSSNEFIRIYPDFV